MVEAKKLVNILKCKCFITKTLGLPIIRLKYLFLILGPPLRLKAPPLENKGGALAPPSIKKCVEAWRFPH